MSEVLLRDVDDADLEVFYEQQREEEAVRRAQFPARDRNTFLTHWRPKVLGNPTGHVQTVTVDGEVAGNVLAWWQEDRRFVGYWFGQRFWGRGVGTAALRQFLQREQVRPLYAEPFVGNTASADSSSAVASGRWAPTAMAISSSWCSGSTRAWPTRADPPQLATGTSTEVVGPRSTAKGRAGMWRPCRRAR